MCDKWEKITEPHKHGAHYVGGYVVQVQGVTAYLYRHRTSSKEWSLHCREAGVTQRGLQIEKLEHAKDKAVDIISHRLHRESQRLNRAASYFEGLHSEHGLDPVEATETLVEPSEKPTYTLFETDEEFGIVTQWVITEAEVIDERIDDQDKIDAIQRLAQRLDEAKDDLWPDEVRFDEAELKFISDIVDWRQTVSDEIRHDDPTYNDEYRVMTTVAERIARL